MYGSHNSCSYIELPEFESSDLMASDPTCSYIVALATEWEHLVFGEATNGRGAAYWIFPPFACITQSRHGRINHFFFQWRIWCLGYQNSPICRIVRLIDTVLLLVRSYTSVSTDMSIIESFNE